MPITDPTKALSQINRLLSAFPAANSADPDAVLMRYVEAITDHEYGDLEAAVTDYVKGRVPGQNPRFAPTPPELSGTCRRIMETRLDDANRHRKAVRQIEARDQGVDKTDASRAKVAAKLAEGIAGLAAGMLTEDAAAARRKASLQDRVDRRFAAQDEDETRRRLGYAPIPRGRNGTDGAFGDD